MARTLKIYKVGDVTCIDETINGKTTYLSSNQNRELEVIPGGVKIVPDPNENIWNNFTILREEVEDNYETTTDKAFRDALLSRDFFKKGGGGVSGGEALEEFTLVETSLGRFNSGDTIPAHESNNERWKDIGRKRTLPTFTLPVANIAASINPNNTTEVGTILNDIIFTASLTQNDGGSASNYKILKDNSEVLNDVAIAQKTETIQLNTTPTVFKAVIAYNEGTVSKLDSFGNEVANTIVAGEDESTVLSYAGYLPIFYGSSNDDLTSSNEIRSLQKILTSNNDVFNLETGLEHTKFYIFLPNGISLFDVLHSNINDNITNLFTPQNITIKDIGGVNDVEGKLYKYQISTPFGVSQTFKITKR